MNILMQPIHGELFIDGQAFPGVMPQHILERAISHKIEEMLPILSCEKDWDILKVIFYPPILFLPIHVQNLLDNCKEQFFLEKCKLGQSGFSKVILIFKGTYQGKELLADEKMMNHLRKNFQAKNNLHYGYDEQIS